MDMRKYSAGVVKPEDLYDGPRVEKIINVFKHDKHNCAVLEFESGDQLFLWNNLSRVLKNAWGYESDNWLGQDVELSLGHYLDKKTEPPAEKECIAIRAISPRKAEAANGGLPAIKPPLKDDLSDDIPF
jgi:hypothetical protein